MTARTSAMTGGSNSFQTTAEDINANATDFLADGIVGAITNTSGVAPTTGGLSVNAQGTPDRTVAIGAGIAYVTATPTSQASQRLRVQISAQNLTHSTNVTGSTRFDWIYVQVSASLAANPAVAGDTTGTMVISRSTSSTVDNGTPPTYGYHIATVTLTNSYTTIVNGNIADTRVQTGATSTPGTASTGMPIQIADTLVITSTTGTTLIPFDDTIPQNGEGDQYMTLAFTPKVATSKLYIDVLINLSSSTTNNMSAALFKDSDTNALASTIEIIDTATGVYGLSFSYSYSPGATTAITFKVRGGGSGAATTTLNGSAGSRKHGGSLTSYIRVTEVHG